MIILYFAQVKILFTYGNNYSKNRQQFCIMVLTEGTTRGGKI